MENLVVSYKVKYTLIMLLLLLSHFSRIRLCATPSLGFSRQEHWSGLPFPSPMHKSEKWKWSRSIMSDSSRPHGLQPTRLLRPWDFPSKSTGVGCRCLLWCSNSTLRHLHKIHENICLTQDLYIKVHKSFIHNMKERKTQKSINRQLDK